MNLATIQKRFSPMTQARLKETFDLATNPQAPLLARFGALVELGVGSAVAQTFQTARRIEVLRNVELALRFREARDSGHRQLSTALSTDPQVTGGPHG